jgi:hypothetical protein
VRRRVWSEVAKEGRLYRVCGSSSPPHQLIAFAFVNLLEWRPQRLVAELSNTHLGELEEKLEDDYRQRYQLAMDRVRSCCRRLRQRMDRRFEEGVEDSKTLQTYRHLAGRIVGDTTLRNYYTGNSTDSRVAEVIRWRNMVEERLRNES